MDIFNKTNQEYLKEYREACRNYDTLIVSKKYPQTFLLLDIQNRDRILSFLNEKPGWLWGEGEALDRYAFMIFLDFIHILNKKYKTLFKKLGISIFMGPEGSVEIIFADVNKKEFNIEFFRDKIEYYSQTTEEVEIISLEYIHIEPIIINLIDKIKEIFNKTNNHSMLDLPVEHLKKTIDQEIGLTNEQLLDYLK